MIRQQKRIIMIVMVVSVPMSVSIGAYHANIMKKSVRGPLMSIKNGAAARKLLLRRNTIYDLL